MVTKSKLKLALSAEKGIDWHKLQQKKKQKDAERRKRKASTVGGPADSEGDAEETDEDEVHEQNGMIGMDESDSSGSDIELEEAKPRNRRPEAVKSGSISAKEQAGKKADGEGEDEDGDEDEDDEDIPVSDLEDLPDEDKEDLIRHTRLTINNTAALTASRIRIAIPTDSSAAFATHMSITSSKPTADAIPDISNDLDREQAFHAQALEAVKQARQLLKKEGVPLTRPNDYFAEMVKDDGHMERVKTKLVEEATAKKASAEARKLRDLKKFGKQVQVAKLQERHKAKRETLEKVKLLKRKRQESSNDLGTNEADIFDVAVDNELKSHASKQASAGARGGRNGDAGPKAKRQKKDEKYGFGGKKRYSKSGDAVSTGDMSGFSAKRMKDDGPSRGGGAARRGGRGGGTSARGGKAAPRLGKNRRKAVAGKR